MTLLSLKISMASSLSLHRLLHFLTALSSISLPLTSPSTVIEDFNTLQPPPDFNATITANCRKNPSLRYCTSSPPNLAEIFRFTIVASHLCNASNNPNCVESFPKIDLRSRPKLAPLYLSFSFFWKYCPSTILSIDLSRNNLNGNFPNDILYCSQIQALDLSHNNLSGDFPVKNFLLLKNLTFLNLSYNGFTECKVSETQFFARFNSSCFVHSGLLPDHGDIRIKFVVFFIGFPVFVVLIVVFLGWFCFWTEEFRGFSREALEEATGGFSKRNLAGKTGRGSLYRGVLRDGSVVRIEVCFEGFSREERRRFVEEGRILVQLQHRNIAGVLGWCEGRGFRGVVSEWVEGEDVDTWLRGCVRTWKERVRVMSGVGAGVCYLQKEWPQGGYSLKLRDLVVCEDGEAVITGLKVGGHRSSTKKIYRLGMLVLQIVTNRRPDEAEFEKKETGFVEWVKSNLQNPENVIHRRMKMTAEKLSEAAQIVEFGLMCADLSSRRQPRWDQICDILSNTSCANRRTPHVDRGRVHKHAHHTEH